MATKSHEPPNSGIRGWFYTVGDPLKGVYGSFKEQVQR